MFQLLFIYYRQIMHNNSSDEQQKDVYEIQTKLHHPAQIPIKPTQHFHLPSKSVVQKKIDKKDFAPARWEDYFDELFYLHDGTSVFRAGNQGAVFFCIHGAGHSALSFATLAKQIKKFGILIAFDFKGHGYSKKVGNLEDLSIQNLKNQTKQVLAQMITRFSTHNFILVGHSLGGSICSRITEQSTKETWSKTIQGMIIIDVVQGTALEALPFMMNILQNRPKIFKTVESAIQWSVSSGILKKLESAKVSIPPQLKEVIINGNQKKYQWKVDLMKSQKYWSGWFTGLSASFLNVKIPKILITAEKERLDKQLTIAQMQGKFKLSILHNVGHSVQEDDYVGTAKLCHDFLTLFRIPMTQEQQQQRKKVGLAKFHPKVKQY